MKIILKKNAVIGIFIFFAGFLNVVLSQAATDEQLRNFFIDAVIFKSDVDSLGRVDVFVVVPYQSLNFLRNKDVFGAKYDITIKILNSDGQSVQNKTITRNIHEKDYFTTQGGNGKFDYTQTVFKVKPGKYEIDVNFTDDISKKSGNKSREITVTDFSKYPFSLSGILFLSSIEENGTKFIITPHVSDNVGDIADHFFIFFEAYSKTKDSIPFGYEIRTKDGEIKYRSPKQFFRVDSVTRQYIKVKLPADLSQNTFILRLVALKPGSPDEWKESDYKAVSERTIRYYKSYGGIVIQDIDKAIKQMKYVATDEQIENITKSQALDEKQKKFDEFWKGLDPSPNTDRNEAFDEYYSRIEFANKNFRSTSEGWKTDKGNVYVVYGRPYNIEKTNPYGDSRTYERWTYTDGKQFLFYDASGFGDFRLYSPLTVTDKYHYEK